MNLLKIDNVYAKANEKEILKGLNLTINNGETHVIMGPNGAGKSTLANVIFNNPAFTKTKGKIYFEGQDITDLSTDKIAKLGIFMSFQAPEEIEGITVMNFLKSAISSKTEQPIKVFQFKRELEENMKKLNMDLSYATRDLNVGFSGGEKKKNEILQLLTLNPKLAILDETDSGLDVDAIRTVSKGIKLYNNENNAILMITHNKKLLENLKVDYVHVLVDGKIVKTGDKSLADKIDKEGYKEFLNNE